MPDRGRALLALLAAVVVLVPQVADAGRRRPPAPSHEAAGHLTFASPQSNPIALSPAGDFVFVASTTSNLVDIISTTTNAVVKQVPVGIDPVGIGVIPEDGTGWSGEVWVANHVSDSISVIDGKFASPTWGQVIETIQDLDANGVTLFDEPVGIAFSEDGKRAFVTLSSRDQIAVLDTALCDQPCSPYQVVHRLDVAAQDPRALAVRGNRLYVAAFESHNRSMLSACEDFSQDPACTLNIDDVGEFVVNPNLPNDVKDIVVDTALPDRDLFVFDISVDPPVQVDVVDGVGTLLYGVAVDSSDTVYVTQADARNAANGPDGQNLIDLQNRMFLNRIAVVNCSGSCGTPTQIELDAAVGTTPAANTQLATPFGVAVSGNGDTLVATAAGSSRLFTLDLTVGTGGMPSAATAGRFDVGAIPRGVALRSDATGAAQTAYVLNTLGNTVSVVDVTDPTSPSLDATVNVGNDPTPSAVRLGRIAFNDADASTEGTFSCASCHPDGNTDQLLWRIGGECTFGNCTENHEPRSTMPVRGLRDSVPLHWDGTLGDPFGGSNGRVGGNGNEPANCNPNDLHTCFRQLVDASQSGVMCDQSSCPNGPSGLPGLLTAQEREDMATFLESVSYPPARSRRMDDSLSVAADGITIRGVAANALEGFSDFFFDQGGGGSFIGNPQTCSDSDAGCHEVGLGVSNSSETLQGFDAPTMRGLNDRFIQFSNGITAAEDLMVGLNDGTCIDVGLPFCLNAPPNIFPWNPADGYEETTVFGAAFAAFTPIYAVGPAHIFQMIEEASTGHSGALGRQVMLNQASGGLQATDDLLAELEAADARGVVNLRGSGLYFTVPVTISYLAGTSQYQVAGALLSHAQMLTEAQNGNLLAVLTAQPRAGVSESVAQPVIRPVNATSGTGTNDLGDPALPILPGDNPMTLEASHVEAGAVVFVDGQPSPGASIDCAQGGGFPVCNNDRYDVTLATVPPNGTHVVQLLNPSGLLSNEMPFCVGAATGCL